MKQTQLVEEVDEDTWKVVTTSYYNREEYRRTFAPAMAVERTGGVNMITVDNCIEEDSS